MAGLGHINAIGAGLFSDLAVGNFTTTVDEAVDTDAEFLAFFVTETETVAGGTFSRIVNVREFPAIGTPANVVNVPTFGSKTSSQIQAQADAPSLEVTLNYIPALWTSGAAGLGTNLGRMVGAGTTLLFRFTLMLSDPGVAKYASTATGLGLVRHSCWYWRGKIDALLITPSLSDASTATLTLTIQSPFYGPYTY